ncbi:hypothetical protein GCM10010273_13510 [Streptomyces lavendulocolor]
MIGLGVVTIGFSQAGDTAAVANIWAHDGLFPKGVGSSLMTLQGVMFAYLAVELVGVTAGESENPGKTLPKSINTLPWRIIVFHVGALSVIQMVVTWTEFEAGVSPFVAAFAKIGPAGHCDRELRRPSGRAVLLQLRHVLHRPPARVLVPGAGRHGVQLDRGGVPPHGDRHDGAPRCTGEGVYGSSST